MAQTCPLCRSDNVAGARFCNQCGTLLQGGGVLAAGKASVLTTTGMLTAPTLLRGGRYQVVQTIGQGGMGAVYKALDLHLSRRVVAIKEMSQQGLAGRELQEATAAFSREAAMLAHLKHGGLPRIYEQFEDGGRRYLVMELIEGQTLERRLESVQKRGQHVGVEEAISLGCKLCGVLEYLHGQTPPIIFRDLKPANIMLTPEGSVYLIDFGIARFFKPGQAKDTTALGSAGYAPPEQYRQATSVRSDIYALGATLHAVLTGDDPSLNPFLFRPFLVNPPELERLILRMVNLDEQRRPGSVQEVRERLEEMVVLSVGNGHAEIQTKGSLPVARASRVPPPKWQAQPSKPIKVGVLLSAHPTDQRLWLSMRGQLLGLLDGFPAVEVQEIEPCGGMTGAVSMPDLLEKVDTADAVVFLLSQDFVDSGRCMAMTERALDRRDHEGIGALSVHLRACHVPGTRLGAVRSVPEDTVAHSSLYAQEQRVLEVAKEMRRLVVMRIMHGRKAGRMSLLDWLLWQLYGYGEGTCPYFTYGTFFLRNMRPFRARGNRAVFV